MVIIYDNSNEGYLNDRTYDEQLAMALQMSLQCESQDMETDGNIAEDPSTNQSEDDDHSGGEEETRGCDIL